MSGNYHTKLANGVNGYSAAGLGTSNEQLDLAITYNRDKLINCAGDITWDGSTLSWSGIITIMYQGDNGNTYKNTIAAGSIAIADGAFAYITLDEDTTAITVATLVPSVGSVCNFKANGIVLLGWRNGTKFTPISLVTDMMGSLVSEADPPIYNLASFYPEVPGDSAVLLAHTFPVAVDFPANFSGSISTADIAATASTVFSIKKNGTEVGTITFGASGTSGTFASTGGLIVSFAIGDRLTIVNAATADTTLGSIDISLLGER